MNNTNTNTTINTSATNGSGILTGGNGGSSQESADLRECLAKLELVLANQARLEQLLVAQNASFLGAIGGAQRNVSINA